MTAPLAIVGGTGFTAIAGFHEGRRESLVTPYGAPSAPLVHGTLHDRPVVTLQRHGARGNIPPHRVNYRANLWAVQHCGARDVIAIAAVGGIAAAASPGRLVFPEQLVDYTYGREHTFEGSDPASVRHVDFTHPYSAPLRARLVQTASRLGLDALDGGVYGATQGPRLETAAEIAKLERDGCTVVGMTGMPEAALARELDLGYACCAVVVNPAAGKSGEAITMDVIRANLQAGMQRVDELLVEFARTTAKDEV